MSIQIFAMADHYGPYCNVSRHIASGIHKTIIILSILKAEPTKEIAFRNEILFIRFVLFCIPFFSLVDVRIKAYIVTLTLHDV